MGIWRDGKIIYGGRICVDSDLVEAIKKYDKDFEINNDDSEWISGNTELIHRSINKWLKEKFPNIRIVSSTPIYDCDYEHFRFYITCKSDLYEADREFTPKEILTRLQNFDLENYEKVYKIMLPNEEYVEPTVFAVPHIW